MNSTEYYRKNPDAAARKVAYQKKVNARPEEKKRRAELNKERRRRGIAGKGGPDVSHTTSGRTVLEDPHTNRGRQGAGGKPRLKKDELTEWTHHDGAYAYGFKEDAAGKPCGNSWIGKNENCTKRSTKFNPAGLSKKNKELYQRVSTMEKIGIGAGVVALGATALTAGRMRRLGKASQVPGKTPKEARAKINTVFKEGEGMNTALGVAGAAGAAAGFGLLGASRKEMFENKGKMSASSAAKFAAGAVLSYAGTGVAMGSLKLRRALREKKVEMHQEVNKYERAYNQAQAEAKRRAEEARRRAKAEGGQGWSRQRTSPNKAVVNPYRDLGVSETATEREITAAWKKLMRKHHPDMGGDPEKAKQVNAAYTEIMRRMGRVDRLDAMLEAWRD